MTDPTEVAKIAGGLSKAQREAFTRKGYLNANDVRELTLAEMGRMNFNGIGGSTQFQFNETGLAVRAHLQKAQPHD